MTAPIGGACDWSCVSSAAKSAGTASGMVVSICATFIIGPFIEPKRGRERLGVASRARRPRSRLTPTRAAKRAGVDAEARVAACPRAQTIGFVVLIQTEIPIERWA